MNKITLAGVAGLLDPALLDLARNIAARIPQDSFLRSRFIESLAGAFRGVIETSTEHMPAPASVATEKAMDVWEFASAFLRENKNERSNPEEEIISSIADRLKKAKNLGEETARIKKELERVKEIMQMVYPAKEETITPLQVINNRLKTIRDKLQERSAK